MSTPSQPFIELNCPRCSAPLPAFTEDVTCQYCGTHLILRRTNTRPIDRRSTTPASEWPAQKQPAAGHAASAPSPGSNSPQGLPTVPLSYVDPRTGMDAFSVDIPVGWQFEGGLVWQNLAATPCVLSFRLYSPNKPELVEVFPNKNYGWTEDPTIRMRVPLGGQFYQTEFRPPMPAAQYIREYMLPCYRGQFGNIEIIGDVPDPKLQQSAMENARQQSMSCGSPVNFDVARLAVRYPVDGVMTREEVAVAIFYHQVITGWTQSLYWWTEMPGASRATEETFEQWKAYYIQLGNTFKWNQQFLAACKQIGQQMTAGIIRQQNQMGQAALRIGQQLSQLGDIQWQSYLKNSAETDRQFQAWQNNQARMDHVHDQWSQTIRGTENYQDSSGQTFELPNGYAHAWTNALGEIIMTDDHLYDPNLGSNVSWTPMKREGN